MKKINNDISERYRELRDVMEGYSNAKCISIASNSAIEENLMIAKNFAMKLAKGGKKTLFIDCSFGGNNSGKVEGLIEMIKVINMEYISDPELKNYISKCECENLSMLTLGNVNLNNYISLLKIENLKLAIERLKISFDYIIMYMPLQEDLDYTEILNQSADECLFVTKGDINEVS